MKIMIQTTNDEWHVQRLDDNEDHKARFLDWWEHSSDDSLININDRYIQKRNVTQVMFER